MDQNASIQNIWLIIAIWSITYLADYYLTIIAAKKYRDNLQEHVSYGGSYELTPQFQKDIDRLRVVSPQFLFRWLLSIPLMFIVWWIAFEGLEQPAFFYFLIGALILREAVIILRHFRNLSMYYFAGKGGGIKGKIEYERWLILKQSAADLLGFSVLFLVLAMIFKSWFFVGGLIGCLVVALKHWRMAIKAQGAVLPKETS